MVSGESKAANDDGLAIGVIKHLKNRSESNAENQIKARNLRTPREKKKKKKRKFAKGNTERN